MPCPMHQHKRCHACLISVRSSHRDCWYTRLLISRSQESVALRSVVLSSSCSLCEVFYSSTGEPHGSCITIHSDMLTSRKPLSGDTCAKNSRNTILAGDNRTMTERAAHISNYPCGQSKEWRPGGRRDPGYQDLPLSHLCELISAMDDPRYASDISRAGCDSFQHIPCWLTSTGGQ